MTNNFNSRETYIAYVKAWKETYKANSETIRTLKADIKAEQKSGNTSKASSMQASREYMRKMQTRALQERAEMKIEAQKQWEAERAEKVAA
jgi:hypothetical protein